MEGVAAHRFAPERLGARTNASGCPIMAVSHSPVHAERIPRGRANTGVDHGGLHPRRYLPRRRTRGPTVITLDPNTLILTGV